MSTTGKPKADPIPSLVVAADADTLFRDLYLRRGRTLLAPRCPLERFVAVRDSVDEADRLLRQAREAVSRQRWEYVRELSARAGALRKAVERDVPLLELAHAVYDAGPVALDPFSPGLAQGRDPRQIRAAALAALDVLTEADVEQAEFYRTRRSAVAALAGEAAPDATEQAAGSGVASAEQRARQALDSGDADALRRIADDVLGTMQPAAGPGSEGAADVRGISVPSSLGEPLPPACVERAAALGLEPAVAELGPAAAAVNDFIEQNAWRASAATMAAARDGVLEVRKAFEGGTLPSELADAVTETVSLFALQLYVNSAGLRFIPVPAPTEHTLVEAFPEGDEGRSALLEALGLSTRRALARATIEAALLERGAQVLENGLGLDPATWRLVCIPADLYVRLGGPREWGLQPVWTHFDGYQVMQGGSLRALVGGNAKFGGLADLCSINAADERDNVTTRFAVVRRDRLAVRLR